MIPFSLLGAIVGFTVLRAARNKSIAPQQIPPAVNIVLLKFFVAAFVFGLTVGSSGPLFSLAVQAVLVAFCLPTLLIAPALVWLGRPRLVYWIMRCCTSVRYAGNQHAGAMLYATLAATRLSDPAAACAWLDGRLRNKPVNGVLGQSILGHLAAAQGDRVTAHCLFESIDARPCPALRSIVRVTARDWLVMDAARRGDWFAAVRYGTRGGSTSRWSRAVACMAQTFAGLPPFPKWRLWLLWLVAPRRLRLRPLLERALRVNVRAREPDIPHPRELPAAMALLAEMLAKAARRAGEVSSAQFLAAVRAVTVVLESTDMKAQVGQRLAALDSTLSRSADSVLSDFKSDLVELISPVVVANPWLVANDRDQPIVAEVLRRLQETTFESIEMRVKDLARRAEKKQALDPLSEWQAWAIVSDEANRLLALQPGAKAALFEVVWWPLINFAVFQHNEMGRCAFAQDIFRWLRAHADDNLHAAETLDKNIACYQPKD